MATIFLKANETGFGIESEMIYSIDESRIETINTYETYDSYGQKVGHYNAGDYSVHNSACELPGMCKAAIAEKFNLDEDDVDLSGEEIDYSGDQEIDEEAINKFIAEYEAENSLYTEVKGFNYWNGHNWQTIITSDEFGEPTHNIIDDNTLIAELNKAIEEMEFDRSGFGREIHKGNGYYIIRNNYARSWANYEIIPEETADMLNLNL